MDLLAIAAGAAHYVYLLMFLSMIIAGPVITAAGAFAAGLGYLNIWLVFLVSIVGNLVPDAIYYLIGYWGRRELVDKYGRYLRITPKHMEKLEGLYHKHIGKTMTIVKLAPVLATPGLIVAGIARIPLKKFVIWSFIVTVPSSLFYLLIGYYSGAAYQKVIHYANYGGYIIAAAIGIFILISYLQRKYDKKLEAKLED